MTGDLGLVWDEVEAALPEGARMGVHSRETGQYEAWAQSKERRGLGFGYGDSPAEALLALLGHLNDAEI